MDLTYIFASVTMIRFTEFMLLLVTVMIICKHLLMDRIVSLASSIYGFDLYFCVIDFMIRFNDVIIFFCL